MTGTPLELAASAVQKTMESWNIIDKTAESFVPRFEINGKNFNIYPHL